MSFQLWPDELQAFLPGQPSKTCVYADAPAVRATVGQGLRELVAAHERTIFGHHCGRCGNSCRRPEILVRESEVLALQQRLGLSEWAFRERYLEPATATWNPRDGFLRHERGACAFLQDGEVASCSVYDVRPESCRSFASNAPMCVKNPDLLIEELKSARVGPSETRISLKSGEARSVPTPLGWFAELERAVAEAEQADPNKYATILDKALVMLQGLEGEALWEGHRGTLEALETLLREAGELVYLRPALREPLEDGWARVRSLLARLAAEPAPAPAPRASGRQRPAGLEWLQLEETGLSVQVKGKCSQREFRTEPRLAELAWDLVLAVLERPEDSLQQAVQEAEPACTMCGECCRLFAVEVSPTEQRELCQFLKVSQAEFSERYTIPGRFGWNPGNRILKKLPTHLYSKRLKELPLVAPEGQGVQCVFLERRSDGFFGCGVYPARPRPCRDFHPTSSLCRKTNSQVNPGRQAHSLRSLYLDAEAIRLYTVRGHDAVRVPRGAWPEVEAAARALEAAAVASPKRRRR